MTNLIVSIVTTVVTNFADIDRTHLSPGKERVLQVAKLQTNTHARIVYNGKTNEVLVEQSDFAVGESRWVTNSTRFLTNQIITVPHHWFTN